MVDSKRIVILIMDFFYKTSVLLFVVFIHGNIFTQTIFPISYDYNGRASTHFSQIIDNDTLVFVGSCYKDNDSTSNQQGVFISFIDSCGNVIRYKKIFDNNGSDLYLNPRTTIAKTADSGYSFGGNIGNGNKGFIIKVNHTGDLAYYKTINAPSGSIILSIERVIEIDTYLYWSGYISNDFNAATFMLKTDSDGNVIFFNKYGNHSSCDFIGSMSASIAGKIIIGGSRTNICYSSDWKSSPWISEIDTNGLVLWEWVDTLSSKFGITGNIYQTNDKGWIYCGIYLDSVTFNNKYISGFITRLDSSFHKEWTQILGNPTDLTNGFFRISLIDDTTCLIGGDYTIGSPYKPDAPYQKFGWILKVSLSKPDTIWSTFVRAEWDTYHSTQTFLNGLGLLSSGSIIASGYLYRTSPNFYNKAWLSKFSDAGIEYMYLDTICGTKSSAFENNQSPESVIMYPNPFTNQLNIFSDILLKKHSFYLYGMNGKCIIKLDLPDQNISIDTTSIPPGIYFWEIIYDGVSIRNGKLVKIR